MINDILTTTKKIMDGTLLYQNFSRDLKASEDYSANEKQIVRSFVNGLLNRYYRYLYSLTAGEESDLAVEEVLALALYSYSVEKNIAKLNYVDVLSTLSAPSQIKLEERYPENSFPIKIPSTFHNENLVLSYATRFSVPLHVIELLVSDIGKKNILRFLTTRLQESVGLINHNLITDEAFFAKYKDFIPGLKSGQFIYKGCEFIKKTDAYNNNEIVISSQSLLDISDLVAEINPKSILFVQHSDTSLLLLIALLYPEVTIDFSASETKSKFILQHLIKKFNLQNVKFVSTITKTYDLVLTTVSNSAINGNIRQRDFYYRLPLDFSLFSEKAASELANLKDYVSETGSMIFVTTTALRNETHYQALTFIRDFAEFTLEREKQYFHFNDHHETVYFALFKKGSRVEQG